MVYQLKCLSRKSRCIILLNSYSAYLNYTRLCKKDFFRYEIEITGWWIFVNFSEKIRDLFVWNLFAERIIAYYTTRKTVIPSLKRPSFTSSMRLIQYKLFYKHQWLGRVPRNLKTVILKLQMSFLKANTKIIRILEVSEWNLNKLSWWL